MPISKFEESILNQLEWDRALTHIKWLTEEAPGRHSGAEDEEKAANYIQESLSQYGISVTKYEVDAYLGVPEDANLKILEPKELNVKCSPKAPTPFPITGEILLIESKEEAKEKYKDIEGKIVLAPYSYGLPITPEEIRENGGQGMIMANWGGPEHDVLRVTSFQTWTYWGWPSQEGYRREQTQVLPRIFISRKDFEDLRPLFKEGTVKATFDSRVSSSWTKVHPVVAEVKCADDVNDFVLLGGHLDSWSPGATDNAAGDGLMMELARVFQKNRADLRKNIRIGFWTGHENGSYAGSTWYLDNFWTEINRYATSFSAVDTPGFKDATEYNVRVSEEISDFVVGCVRDVVGDKPTLNVMRPGKYTDMAFFGIGLPSIFIRNAFSKRRLDQWNGAVLGWWNHSPYDTIDKIGEENFTATMRIRALETLRLCNSDILPFDFIKVAETFRKRVQGWEEIAPSFNLEDTRTYVDKLYEKTRNLNEALKGRKLADSELKEVNSLLRKLARVLIPINYTTVGRFDQDIFGTDLSKPLAALRGVDDLMSLKKASPEEIILRAKLFKDKNRVNEALVQAIELIDAFV